MKIGIDAKWYFDGPPSGVRVIKNLVDNILKRNDGNEYVIFLNKKHKNEIFPVGENRNFILHYVWAVNNLFSNIFILPFFSRRFKLDALLYQNFISPFDPSKRIAYIHDVLFLSNPEFYTIYERLYFFPLRFLTKRANAIITVSKEEKERLLKYRFSDSSSEITVAYHGVDRSFFSNSDHTSSVSNIRARFKLPDEFLLYVGRLNLRKNIDNLLCAIPLLKNQEINLVIVGATDWKESNHANTIKKLGIKDRVIFTGAISEELPQIYSMATLFCFPSLAESFGLPPLEAMASGVPVVISNTTSLPEICGEAGNYVDPVSPISIALVIDNLLIDSNLYSTKKEMGLKRAKEFTWKNAADIVIKCIQQTVEKNALNDN